ncbi:phage baseplate assembly protein V [Chitinimonas taiwanensis]|uniref:Phage-related baseplate assembly protein n=1 Tax=Chitinimonas taiwanensis DSM 18899 TaxID=1121279 RepID=A0A1K2HKU0_9NEIS|nr:phage baseplate assembly protein V [Chitinimonas taiwanensis]SFZ77391.1 Phage-related baseplate assembly protein [Chitinimonas taiwanensis DSM 18899]
MRFAGCSSKRSCRFARRATFAIQLAHAAGDNAPGSEAGFTWVRVAEWLAGPNWGTQFTPRVGDEVLIDFMEGDVDRPMVVGSLYNDQAIPPYAAGHDGPANHAGHLSGFHSQTPMYCT